MIYNKNGTLKKSFPVVYLQDICITVTHSQCKLLRLTRHCMERSL